METKRNFHSPCTFCVKGDIEFIDFDRAVYWLYDEDFNLLYIGISTNVKNRLNAHFHGTLQVPNGKATYFKVIKEEELPKNIEGYELLFLNAYKPPKNAGTPQQFLSYLAECKFEKKYINLMVMARELTNYGLSIKEIAVHIRKMKKKPKLN